MSHQKSPESSSDEEDFSYSSDEDANNSVKSANPYSVTNVGKRLSYTKMKERLRIGDYPPAVPHRRLLGFHTNADEIAALVAKTKLTDPKTAILEDFGSITGPQSWNYLGSPKKKHQKSIPAARGIPIRRSSLLSKGAIRPDENSDSDTSVTEDRVMKPKGRPSLISGLGFTQMLPPQRSERMSSLHPIARATERQADLVESEQFFRKELKDVLSELSDEDCFQYLREIKQALAKVDQREPKNSPSAGQFKISIQRRIAWLEALLEVDHAAGEEVRHFWNISAVRGKTVEHEVQQILWHFDITLEQGALAVMKILELMQQRENSIAVLESAKIPATGDRTLHELHLERMRLIKLNSSSNIPFGEIHEPDPDEYMKAKIRYQLEKDAREKARKSGQSKPQPVTETQVNEMYRNRGTEEERINRLMIARGKFTISNLKGKITSLSPTRLMDIIGLINRSMLLHQLIPQLCFEGFLHGNLNDFHKVETGLKELTQGILHLTAKDFLKCDEKRTKELLHKFNNATTKIEKNIKLLKKMPIYETQRRIVNRRGPEDLTAILDDANAQLGPPLRPLPTQHASSASSSHHRAASDPSVNKRQKSPHEQERISKSPRNDRELSLRKREMYAKQ